VLVKKIAWSGETIRGKLWFKDAISRAIEIAVEIVVVFRDFTLGSFSQTCMKSINSFLLFC
jgi:hypothetical protein